MSFLKRLNQLFPNQSFQPQHWTKHGLSQLKETQLLQLAKDNNFEEISGTKEEIVRQLVELSKDQYSAKGSREDIDSHWVNAFENKVAHRGRPESSHRRKVIKGPHPMNDNIFKRRVYPVEHEPEIEDVRVVDKDMEEDMNKEWVEAFQMKVSSRGSRSQKFRDTLSSAKNTVLDDKKQNVKADFDAKVQEPENSKEWKNIDKK